MSDFLGAKGPTILGNALHNSWYFLVQILRELRRAPPRVLRIMQIISRLGRSLPPSICRHFHYSHARYTARQPARRVIMRSFFANRLTLSLSPPKTRESHQPSIRSIDPSTNQTTSSLIQSIQCQPTNKSPQLASKALMSMPLFALASRSSRLHCLSGIYRDPQQDLHDPKPSSPRH